MRHERSDCFRREIYDPADAFDTIKLYHCQDADPPRPACELRGLMRTNRYAENARMTGPPYGVGCNPCGDSGFVCDSFGYR